MKRLCIGLISLIALLPMAQGQTADFPSKPIRIVVPFTPGSSADRASRHFGELMGSLLKTPFIVENRPGAAGLIAINEVEHAPADGYMILLASNSTMSVNPWVLKSVPRNPAENLRPIGGISRGVNMLVVGANSPFKTLDELIAAGKKDKQGLNGGTYSAGYRLGVEWLAAIAKFKFTNIAYKGAAQLLTDTAGGQLDFAVLSMDGAAPLVKAGTVRALAISDDARSAEFPDVPTIKESGYPEYTNYSWDSLYVRANTPDAITDKLSTALQSVLATQEARAFIEKSGRQVMAYTPSQMQAYQREELERFGKIAKAAGISPE